MSSSAPTTGPERGREPVPGQAGCGARLLGVEDVLQRVAQVRDARGEVPLAVPLHEPPQVADHPARRVVAAGDQLAVHGACRGEPSEAVGQLGVRLAAALVGRGGQQRARRVVPRGGQPGRAGVGPHPDLPLQRDRVVADPAGVVAGGHAGQQVVDQARQRPHRGVDVVAVGEHQRVVVAQLGQPSVGREVRRAQAEALDVAEVGVHPVAGEVERRPVLLVVAMAADVGRDRGDLRGVSHRDHRPSLRTCRTRPSSSRRTAAEECVASDRTISSYLGTEGSWYRMPTGIGSVDEAISRARWMSDGSCSRWLG